MTKIQPTNNHKIRTISAKLILTGLVAIFLFLMMLSAVINLTGKYFVMRAHINDLKQEQEALKQKQANVANMNQYISTPEGQEEVFREKYRLVKPGEGMIIITNNDSSDTMDTVNTKPGISRFWDSIMRGLGLR